MKKTSTIFALLMLLAFSAFSQSEMNRVHSVPLKPANPLLYGSDVIIYNDLTQDQREANLSIAYNGWIYTVFTAQQGTTGGFFIYKSVDNGETWTNFADVFLPNYSNITTDLVVCGNSLADLYLYQTGVAHLSSGDYVVYVDKYNAVTGAFLGPVYNETSSSIIYDVKIASDYKYPSYGASPYSIGLLYSMYGSSVDELIFISSLDGGNTFTNRKVVTSTGMYLNKVSLSHAICPDRINGRYFASWEEKSYGARTGRVYVSHSNPYVYSDWVTPFRLDDIAGSSENLTKNPVIATQANNVDNDVPDLTAIVLFDRDFYGNGIDYDVIGMYNKNPIQDFTTGWARFDVSNTTYNEFEPDASYDPGYDNFLVTYCDSTNQSLSYVVNGMNLPDPYDWALINGGYNNDANVRHPFPKVEINPVYTQVGHVWIRDRVGGNGVAMWDGEYSSVGIPGSTISSGSAKIFPNPCVNNATLQLELIKTQKVSCSLFDQFGRKVLDVTDKSYTSGTYDEDFDVSQLAAGCYVYEIKTPDGNARGKLIISR